VELSFKQGISIPAGGDRFQEHRKVFGTRSIDYKVLTLDTNGGLSIIEITDDCKGGPSRHLHHEQEEWFYVIDSEYIVEIGDERCRLGPGDSVLAPRKVPHVWAHVGEGTGKLLTAFQPAGKMEAFFGELAKVKGMPQREELQRLFSSHGMELTGPPLPVE
jgi:mannose-6-phosphate isomerase-like protein (cupin superfamily)